MKKYLVMLCLVWPGALLSTLVFAPAVLADTDEQAFDVVAETTDTMVARVAALAAAEDTAFLETCRIVQEEILPRFASRTMARKVMGKYWREANYQQKRAFTKEFEYYLLRFYANLLSKSYEERIEFYESVPMNSQTQTVSTKVTKDGREHVIDYKLKIIDDEWKIVDIVIDNSSLVLSKRGQYNIILSREGIDPTIENLSAQNTQVLGDAFEI